MDERKFNQIKDMVGYNITRRIPFDELKPKGYIEEYKIFKTGFRFLMWRLYTTLIEGYVFDNIKKERIKE